MKVQGNMTVGEAEAYLIDQAERDANGTITDLAAAVAQRFDLPTARVREIIERVAPADVLARLAVEGTLADEGDWFGRLMGEHLQ